MSESIVNIEIFDTTLRDGAQALPISNQFRDGSKPEIADQVARLGISVIEAGMPITPGDEAEVKNVAETVGNTAYDANVWRQGVLQGAETEVPIIAGLCRAVLSDIDITWRALKSAEYPRIHTFISTAPDHMAARFPSPEQVLNMAKYGVRHARELTNGHSGASVEFSAEAASTTDLAFLERVVKSAVDEGADIINLPDTVGQRNPFWMRTFYDTAIGWIMGINTGVAISSHNHNDLDMSTANSFSLVAAAADYAAKHRHNVDIQVETTICGLGERAGNTDVFPFVASLFKFIDQMPAEIRWKFNPGCSVTIANAVLGFAGLNVDRQSPIVGNDILAHRSGIHSDGVIKGGHRIYTPFDPIFWGHSTNARHEEGKYQGRKGREAIVIA